MGGGAGPAMGGPPIPGRDSSTAAATPPGAGWPVAARVGAVGWGAGVSARRPLHSRRGTPGPPQQTLSPALPFPGGTRRFGFGFGFGPPLPFPSRRGTRLPRPPCAARDSAAPAPGSIRGAGLTTPRPTPFALGAQVGCGVGVGLGRPLDLRGAAQVRRAAPSIRGAGLLRPSALPLHSRAGLIPLPRPSLPFAGPDGHRADCDPRALTPPSHSRRGTDPAAAASIRARDSRTQVPLVGGALGGMADGLAQVRSPFAARDSAPPPPPSVPSLPFPAWDSGPLHSRRGTLTLRA